MVTPTLTPTQIQRIKGHFLTKHEVTGVSFLKDRIQVKLKNGAPRPNIPAMEGVVVEYVYEDMRPASG